MSASLIGYAIGLLAGSACVYLMMRSRLDLQRERAEFWKEQAETLSAELRRDRRP